MAGLKLMDPSHSYLKILLMFAKFNLAGNLITSPIPTRPILVDSMPTRIGQLPHITSYMYA